MRSTDPDQNRRPFVRAFAILLLASAILSPYALLLWMSFGSGWTFPNLAPDRLDFAPWRHLLTDRDGPLRAIATSMAMSLVVAVVATSGGLLIGRTVRAARSDTLRFLIYVPFVISPVVIGVCLYDLFVRIELVGRISGVIVAQCIVALSFAAVFFSEVWSVRTDRLVQQVRQFGGNGWDVLRHAVIPPMRGLIAVCFVQTALYSWVDYGLASVLGGGHVATVTTRVFAYLREASVNQAALSGIVLLVPALAGMALTAMIVRSRTPTTSDV